MNAIMRYIGKIGKLGDVEFANDEDVVLLVGLLDDLLHVLNH